MLALSTLIMIYIKLLLTMFVWGATFTSASLLADYVDPVHSAFLRFLIASVVLLTVLACVEKKLPSINARQALVLVAMGVTGVALYNVFFFYGLSVAPAIQGSLITATNPLLTAVVAAFLFKERFTAVRVVGFVVAVCGALLIITRGDFKGLFNEGLGSGELAFVFSAVSWSVYTLLGKKASESMKPLVYVTYSSVVGMLILLVVSLSQGLPEAIGSLTIEAVAHLLFLSILATVIGFVWFQQAVQTLGAARASVFIYFMPVSAVLIAAIVLGEVITPLIVLGTVMIIGGIVLVNRY